MKQPIDPTQHPHGVDIYRGDNVSDFVAAKESGVTFVIHKATQGTRHVDDRYAQRRSAAVAAGLLWGAYHFGTGDAPGDYQANSFLDHAEPSYDTVMALDLERCPRGVPTMTVDQARAFVLRVRTVTGRYPGLYGGSLFRVMLGHDVDPLFENCWLWTPRYSPSWAIEPEVQATWQTWTLWQYTDGRAGPEPRYTPGVGHCDRSIFAGSVYDLRRRWLRGTLTET